MKKLLGIVVLGLFLITPSQADDIKDFQIEGISIGDSLLNYIDKKKISEEIKYNAKYYKQFSPVNKFGEIYFTETSLYDQMSFFVKTNDPKYKIYSMRGMIGFNNNVDKCLEKKFEIINDIENLFKDYTKSEYKVTSSLDTTGRSYTLRTKLKFKNNDSIIVQCSDWEESFRKKNNFGEGISVVVQKKEVNEWLATAN